MGRVGKGRGGSGRGEEGWEGRRKWEWERREWEGSGGGMVELEVTNRWMSRGERLG